MLKDFTLKYLFLFSSLFIALLAIGFYFELPLAIGIPFILILSYLALLRLDNLFWLIVFCTPLSINLDQFDLGGVGLFLPTEPLLFGLLGLLSLKQLFRKTNQEVWRQPLIICLFIYFIWIAFTSATSQLPLVSFKFLLSKLWLTVPVFYFGFLLFKKVENIKKYIWLLLISLSFVIIFTLIRHASFGFSEDAGHWVMSPFFKDHTSYGAIIALMLPVLVAFFQLSEKETTTRFLLLLLIIVFFNWSLLLLY